MNAVFLQVALDPNLAALIAFAIFSLVAIYFVTIIKDPKLLGAVFKPIGKMVDVLVKFINRLF